MTGARGASMEAMELVDVELLTRLVRLHLEANRRFADMHDALCEDRSHDYFAARESYLAALSELDSLLPSPL